MRSTAERPTAVLTGATGQVGFEVHRLLNTSYEVYAPGRQELDLTDSAAVKAYCERIRPSVLVNAAAYTAVDAAETDQEQAAALNTRLPETLARYCAQHHSVILHYSTDYVYPGSGERPFTEEDATGPLSVYGRTKLAGDEAVMASGAAHLIFRTSWVYSARGKNFLKTMLRLAQQKTELSIVGDQIGAPTDARFIAAITALALQQGIPSGIYHLVSAGYTSWCEFAQRIFTIAAQSGYAIQVDPQRVDPIPSSQYPTPAQRPLNSRLSTAKLESALGIRVPSWEQRLDLVQAEYLESLRA